MAAMTIYGKTPGERLQGDWASGFYCPLIIIIIIYLLGETRIILIIRIIRIGGRM